VPAMGFRAMIAAQVDLLRSLLPDGDSVHLGRVADRFRRNSVAIVERNRATLELLANRYRLAVVSNFTGNLDRCLAELNLLRFFSATADSALVGWAKPDPRIFQRALQMLQAVASTAWMVGDNFENDIRPAASLGLSPCWIADPQRR